MKTLKKTMRSTISFLLSITMMLAVFVIPVYADEPEPEDVTIHYYNENNWQSPYLYYYADNNNPVAWPGVAMTSDGDNWYSYTVSNFDEIRIIFSNNGSNQYPAQNEPGILVSGEKWLKTEIFIHRIPIRSISPFIIITVTDGAARIFTTMTQIIVLFRGRVLL